MYVNGQTNGQRLAIANSSGGVAMVVVGVVVVAMLLEVVCAGRRLACSSSIPGCRAWRLLYPYIYTTYSLPYVNVMTIILRR